MKQSFAPNLYVALIHYPVVNKSGDVITAAVTNLDLHDISRAAKTYGVKEFFVVTPLADQKELVKRIILHWTQGAGAEYNPKRCVAMQMIRLADTLEDVIDRIRQKGEGEPKTVLTSAKRSRKRFSIEKLRDLLKGGTPYVLVFGTAWGISEDALSKADYLLEPIMGAADYNHLSVRSAASILLDRLVGTTS